MWKSWHSTPCIIERKIIKSQGCYSIIKEPLIKARQCQRSVEAEHLTAVPATFSSCRKLWLYGNLCDEIEDL